MRSRCTSGAPSSCRSRQVLPGACSARRGRLRIDLDLKRLDHFGLQLDQAANRLTITVSGVAAHAGLHPEWGVNAVLVAAQALARVPNGRIDDETTANFGTIVGGTASTE